MKRNMLLMILMVCLVTLGFNTLDAMIWEFYYYPYDEWCFGVWYLTPTFHVEVWSFYFFGGILPLSVGCFLLGWLLAWANINMANRKKS